jgi:hypothetical protein
VAQDRESVAGPSEYRMILKKSSKKGDVFIDQPSYYGLLRWTLLHRVSQSLITYSLKM